MNLTGGELLATQQQSSVYWVRQDPLVKSKRVTDSSGTVVSVVELDPRGGHTNRSSNDAFQPHKFESRLKLVTSDRLQVDRFIVPKNSENPTKVRDRRGPSSHYAG